MPLGICPGSATGRARSAHIAGKQGGHMGHVGIDQGPSQQPNYIATKACYVLGSHNAYAGVAHPARKWRHTVSR
ncbi:Hypothetical protein NTJ_06225 [Nesidiocoris tenuis]|uniref:Uncharacterized protein n=1 Tax=Nesidiocoris tenuis TaxID=355587 RepID=A0ABN7AMG7_9HEMI|nr:Hypothetical protein NTJ_06225 [Nesidiocoris tenuis]